MRWVLFLAFALLSGGQVAADALATICNFDQIACPRVSEQVIPGDVRVAYPRIHVRARGASVRRSGLSLCDWTRERGQVRI